MATVKISELALITQLNANTSNTLFLAVDLPSGITGKFTGHTLAQGLYSNEVLNVGNNSIVYDNVIAQFSGNSGTYLQINNQNFDANGSTDYVASTNDSDNINNYIDMGINGSEFSDPVYSSMKAYDGYVYSHGPSILDYRGNLVVGTASTDANIVFIAGGTTSGNVVGRISKNVYDFLNPVRVTGTVFTTGGIVFNDGTTQTTSSEGTVGYANSAFVQANAAFLVANTPSHIANSAALYANGAFSEANAAFLVANTPSHTANSAALYANGAFSEANSAFDKANNALANTTGTFAGDLTVAGNLYNSGIVNINYSAFNPNTALVSIVASDNFVTMPPSNTNYMIHVTGKANSVARVVIDSFGQNTYPLYAGRMGRGSTATPAAIANNDIMLRLVGNGYTGTQFPGSSPTKMDFVASENFSDTNRGTRIEFWNTPTGSNTIQKIASFNANTVEFTGSVNPQKGFIYTPRILQGAQTAITIDFSTDSIIRATFNSTLTNSFANYTHGKVVEMWVTNTAGNGQTINLGCLADNTTTGSTTLTVAAGRSAHLKYFSIDGDNANTFVAITYA